MATLVNYKGLDVLSPDPTGDGGLAIQDDFKNLVDWNPKSALGQTTDPGIHDDSTADYQVGSLWLRTDTTPAKLFVCNDNTSGAAVWLPVLLNLVQDTSPQLGGNLDVNGHHITDASNVTVTIAGTDIASVLAGAMNVQGSFLLGTTTIPSGATFNSVLGGGATSPVLGAATADKVSMAGVDKAAGDRRLYVQSEAGSTISLGNDRLNFAAATGIVSVGGTDTCQVTAAGLQVPFLGVGTAPVSSQIVRVVSTTSGAVTQAGIVFLVTADSSATTAIRGCYAESRTSASSFNVSTISSFWAQRVTLGSGSSATEVIGYDSDIMVGASSINASFRGKNGIAANVWNLYMQGTAANYLAGNLIIGGTTLPSNSPTANLMLTGTSPTLGAATADTVSLAAVDKAAGDRRLSLQSELGSVISIGNDRLNFAATTGFVTVGGSDIVQVSANGVGYATGTGGTVTQATSKSTGVTLSKTCGQITLNGAALASNAIVSFTLTNTKIAATDVLVMNHISGGTAGAYCLNAQCAAGSASINVINNTAGSLSEAIVIQFVLVKAVTS